MCEEMRGHHVRITAIVARAGPHKNHPCTDLLRDGHHKLSCGGSGGVHQRPRVYAGRNRVSVARCGLSSSGYAHDALWSTDALNARDTPRILAFECLLEIEYLAEIIARILGLADEEAKVDQGEHNVADVAGAFYAPMFEH